MNAVIRFPDMDADLLKRLMDLRDQTAHEKTEAERHLAEVSDYLKKLESAIVALRAPTLTIEPDSGRVPQGRSPKQRGTLTPREIGDHARQLLLEVQRPLKRGALLRIFDERKIPIVGGDRAKVLGTIVWRLQNEEGKPAFVSTPKGYWPSDVPVPDPD